MRRLIDKKHNQKDGILTSYSQEKINKTNKEKFFLIK